jgi:hypothetical protein
MPGMSLVHTLFFLLRLGLGSDTESVRFEVQADCLVLCLTCLKAERHYKRLHLTVEEHYWPRPHAAEGPSAGHWQEWCCT